MRRRRQLVSGRDQNYYDEEEPAEGNEEDGLMYDFDNDYETSPS